MYQDIGYTMVHNSRPLILTAQPSSSPQVLSCHLTVNTNTRVGGANRIRYPCSLYCKLWRLDYKFNTNTVVYENSKDSA